MLLVLLYLIPCCAVRFRIVIRFRMNFGAHEYFIGDAVFPFNWGPHNPSHAPVSGSHCEIKKLLGKLLGENLPSV